MKLIDEKDNVARRVRNLFQNSFQPVFELASEFGSRNHGAQIQGNQLFVLQCLRNIAFFLVFLTNQLEFGATTISAIYKDRWQMEIFFKALKQNLKIETFVGTSANAVKIQIWTALIAMLILRSLQLRSQFHWSLSNLVSLLR
jgi:IS4 transposase